MERQFDLFFSDPKTIKKDDEAFLRSTQKVLTQDPHPGPVIRQKILRGFVELHCRHIVSIEGWMRESCEAFGKPPELAAIQNWSQVKRWMGEVKKTPKPHRATLTK